MRTRILDYLVSFAAFFAAMLLKRIRAAGIHRLPQCKAALLNAGAFPIANHYYEPRFDYRDYTARGTRILPGLRLDPPRPLSLLHQFVYATELHNLDEHRGDPHGFHFNNAAFEPGDAEVWYQLIRHFKPARIYEIGSGFSTRIARRAITANATADPAYRCEHVCIEPYEMPWLESSGAAVIRSRVEHMDLGFFDALQPNDILFIDSSHIIRPGGDVLFEYLELLPRLRPGVIVHVHDIFTPHDYPREWIEDRVLFWNEQYLLEAFLCCNDDWDVLLALNFLHAFHRSALSAVAPYLRPQHNPASFYIQRRQGNGDARS